MSGLLLCNTYNTPVVCVLDAKAAVYYNCKYCTKNPVKITESLPLLQSARRREIKYPSRADEANKSTNKARYTLSKLLNQTSKLCEYSLDQCSAALIGLKPTYKTSVTTYIYIRKAMTMIIKISNLNKGNTENKNNMIDDEEEVDIEEEEEYYNDKEDISYEDEEEEYYDHDIGGTEIKLESSLRELEDLISKNKIMKMESFTRLEVICL